MVLWLLAIIVLVIVVLSGFILKDVIQKKTSTDILLLGILLILTGGFLIIQPVLPTNTFMVSVGGLGLILFGFFVGILGFFKK